MSANTFEPSSVSLPVTGPHASRPSAALLEQLSHVSAATACATLHRMGIRRTFMDGPRPLRTGQRTVGPALTLQFMPQREDVGSGGEQEYGERHTALWHVLDQVEVGDVLVIQAFGASHTGCLGEMLVRHFHNQGGAGIVVDGRIRDTSKVAAMDLPVWCTGSTPHYATQSELFPWGYRVPVACAGVLVLPMDIIIADDDGAVVVPIQLAAQLAELAVEHEGWEEFSRMRIDEGGRLSRYYPLDDDARKEFEQWRSQRAAL
jgi:regulator of RNase E activity RraA